MPLRALIVVSSAVALGAASAALQAADPLPSWTEGPVKAAILDFVDKVSTEGGPDFVPVAERVAVFDNDGTLWPENPVPVQLAFVLDRLRQKAEQNPGLLDNRYVRAALDGDAAALLADQHQGLFHVHALTCAELTTDQFAAEVNQWLHTARHPRFGCRYDQCVYQPMLEVLALLRARGFKTYLASGGGADFMQAWSERVYGIPPEQVIGSHGRARFEIRDGQPVLVKTLDQLFINDREGKPVGIGQHIGRRPLAAFGNSDGDQAMLEYTTLSNPRASLGLIVHHTDGEREYAYDASPKSTGKLVEALAAAQRRGWIVVDMRRDWSTVFPPRGE